MSWNDGDDFNSGGQRLYCGLWADDLDAATQALIIEACRMKDRLDRLHLLIRGDVESWCSVITTEGDVLVKLDSAVAEARQLETVFRQQLVEIGRRVSDRVSDDEEDGLAGL
ncbi:hypothetical protein OS127_02915 [Corynebacterium sp. P6129]|uniref:hypothetical protein n=1 Tax=Corynebacterium antarcticum TaxID=2800405 RepID=UPI002260E381|nr:hypothetical protein [Corynebacterium antarcticum]MCX7491481.1 hypothetical protein [Corynebacterium antarcticum]